MPLVSDNIIAHLLARLRPKAKSLIFTIYGDAIAQHGGVAWLGSFISLVEPLGLNERMVRTSVHRLARENWLTSKAVGRRAYYLLTESGRHRFAAAHARIYHHVRRPWSHEWTVVMLDMLAGDPEVRDKLRRELGWLGFGQWATGVMIHPDPDEGVLREMLAESGHKALVVRGPAAAWISSEAINETIGACWNLDRLRADYAGFLETFRPVWRVLKDESEPAPALCFAVRTLLMHGYRRAILRDPMLPDELLPADWPGTAARTLCRNLYRRVERQAERHVMATLETEDGPMPDADHSYFTRFGGLRVRDLR